MSKKTNSIDYQNPNEYKHGDDFVADKGSGVLIMDLIESIWGGRKLILCITGLVTFIGIVYVLLQTPVYTASVTILPDTDPAARSQLAQFAGIAAMAGIDLGGVSDILLYPDIIKSESVLRDVVYVRYNTGRYDRPVNLIDFFEIGENTPEEDFEHAIKHLRNNVVSVNVARDTRLVSVYVTTREPKLSSDIANNIAHSLDEYMITKRRTRASEQRVWVEERLKEVEKSLETSEELLKDFRERNIRIADSPRLLLEQQRLMRDVEVNNAMFVELKKQYEAIRIQEIRDMPVVQVLDYARVPVERSAPKRKQTVIIWFMFGFIMSVGIVFVKNFIESSEDNKSFFQRITADVKNDFRLSKRKQ